MFKNLQAAVAAIFQALVPKTVRTIYSPRAEPISSAAYMDVDRIHTIFADAESGNVQDLFALYRDILLADNHFQGEFGKRKLAVLGDVMSTQPADKQNADDVAAATFIYRELSQVPGWINACSHLMDSTLWPLAVVEKIFAGQPDGSFRLRRLVPVPHQLLDYRLGRLMIRETDPQSGYPTGQICEADPTRYIVHRGHLLSTPDNWGGPMRSLVFWWFLGAMDRDAWARFLERFGSPFIVGKYDQGDDASRTILERAFSQATKLFGLVISNETDVELQSVATAPSGEAFEKFIAFANREKSKLILGQTLSSDAQPTGLGSGTSDLQGEVRQDIRQFDAMMLGITLRDQLAEQLLRINGMPGAKPTLIWGGEPPKALASLSDLLAKLQQAGLQIADDALPILSARFGFNIIRAAPAVPTPLDALVALSAGRPFPFRAEDAMDRIARSGAADLSRCFRGTFAPVRRMILESQSPQDLERRLKEFSAGWEPGAAARLLEEALTAFAINGTLVTDR